MPLRKGKSKATKKKNFHELRHGKTYKRTKAKFGKKRAQKQMIAIELKNERKSGKKRARKRA